MVKADIIAILEEIAVLLELKGENPFKIRAYQTGARVLKVMEADLDEVIAADELGLMKGIGAALVEKIKKLHTTGYLDFHVELKASVAPGLIEMLEIPGLGGKKVKQLHDALEVESIEALKEACEMGRVAELKGFGANSAAKILKGIENRAAYAKRHLWWTANDRARPILEGLRGLAEVELAEVAGSLRRLMETVGDLDFIVASKEPEPVMGWFTSLPDVDEITAKGRTKSSVRFKSGLQADLRIVLPEQFVFALHHFTGSKEHNVVMRQRALAAGYSLSEWGLTKKGKTDAVSSAFGIASEKDLFAFFDLPEIPPELREGLGELEIAEVPVLVDTDVIRGVFHNHTAASDGQATFEEMAMAAAGLGFEYLGLADHSKSSVQANGLDDARVLKMSESIKAFNESGKSSVHLFAGVECDILPDGTLDLADETLEVLDYAVMSVHSAFSQSEEEMTARVIRAIEHPATTMLGHPTGRLLLRREPYKIDLRKVVDAAIANRVVIEINANPCRLDMDWRLWRRAADRGLLCAINPDAHSTEGLAYFRAGVNIARKGWLTQENVLNCRDCTEVSRWFQSRQ